MTLNEDIQNILGEDVKIKTKNLGSFYKKESKEGVLLTSLENKINEYKDHFIALANVPTNAPELSDWLYAYDEVKYFVDKIDRVKDIIADIDFDSINDEYIEYVNLKIDQEF